MTKATGRFDYLDGIRAVAIGAVLALHWVSWYTPLFHGGSVGVDVFFVLSGFIITTMLWRTPAVGTLGAAWARFIGRRVVRLYPALLGLVVGATLVHAVVPADLSPLEVVRRGALALAQTTSFWAAGQDGGLWVTELHPFGQTWSLAVEWYFYLLWPLFVLGARAAGWSARRMAATSVVAAVVLYAASFALPPLWFYFGPSARFAEILAGAALALWFQARGVPTTSPRGSGALAAGALSAIVGYAVLGSHGDTDLYRWVGIPVSVVGTLVLIRVGYGDRLGAVHRLLSHPWMATLGRHSYSVYLWHLLPFVLLADVDAVPKPLLGVAVVVATAILGALSYRYLERPFLRARSDVLKPLRPRAKGAALRERGDEVLS